MIKNIVIVIQAIIIVLVAIWAHFYQHRVEQILISESISFYAFEARFKMDVAKRIDAGQTDHAKRMLRNVAATNVEWAEDSVAKLDLRMEDLALDAEHSARILEEIGMRNLSKALRERRKALQE